MKIVKGQVVSNVDTTQSGRLLAMFPSVGPDAYFVTYTSPFFKANAGGFLGIPEKDDEILAVYNPEPDEGEDYFYYHSTIVKREDLNPKDENSKFKPIPNNDRPVYGEKNKPVSQLFTNGAGAGLYIRREFKSSKIDNNVTMRCDTGEEVNVGPLGVQIRNADGDFIVLNGAEPNDAFAARSMVVETQGNQEFKCISSDINMRVVEGGDINIENDSFGFFSVPPWYGNIRLKSKHKDVTIAALGNGPLPSDIHIVTNTAKIKLNGLTGQLQIFSPTTIDINSVGSINLNAGGNISMNAGGVLSMNTQGVATLKGTAGVNIGSGGQVSQNGSVLAFNGLPLQTMNPTGGDVSIVIPVGARPDPAIAGPFVEPPISNAYNDGVVPGELSPGGLA